MQRCRVTEEVQSRRVADVHHRWNRSKSSEVVQVHSFRDARKVQRCRCRCSGGAGAEVQRSRGGAVVVQRCRGAEGQMWCIGGALVVVVHLCRGAEIQTCREIEVQRCRGGAEVQVQEQRSRGPEEQRCCRGAEVQSAVVVCRGDAVVVQQ